MSYGAAFCPGCLLLWLHKSPPLSRSADPGGCGVLQAPLQLAANAAFLAKVYATEQKGKDSIVSCWAGAQPYPVVIRTLTANLEASELLQTVLQHHCGVALARSLANALPLGVCMLTGGTFICTESQARYMLGMRYRGNFVVGLSDKSPRQPRDRAASCPVNYRTPCNAATAAMPDRPNPHVLTGALVSIVNAAVVHKVSCLTWGWR